ncbi:beta-ketoacyl synthase N-terminal-like domain-containing protein [Actinomadura sp. 1N219]|uniref:beta-ketoacyl synthase N-terminal-like domain-containing protein n=1 Tax=Actinomadura sp. 1N219 TaxID=3375152 RepID=UPI0037BE10B2
MSVGATDARSVAVVGMACRLPGAADPAALWELLAGEGDATGPTPADRYDPDELYEPRSAPGRMTGRRGGYVTGMADFDAGFFGMSAAEAVELDPQQRLLLMTAWEALEDAGQPADRLAGSRTGVFVGNSRADYLENASRRGLDALTAGQIGNMRSLLPARLSYVLDVRGPSVSIDTGCSSSLVAVHQAVQSLRSGECPVALAAGVNLPLRPDEGVMMTQAGVLARDGCSKFASASADGHAPGDGVAVVVLKPLEAALAAGDRIRAVIAGSAIGNDGRTSDSVLNPSLTGQVEVLRSVYRDAGVDPSDVDYVEAHGAGSPASDPLELTALGRVLGEGRRPDRPLLVGSVKSNIGHAEAAGGLAGLIKAVLCLEHGRVPASLHAEPRRPDVDWDALPLEIPAALTDLAPGGRSAIAGVSAQGSSSLNAHVVLRQAPSATAPDKPDKPDKGDGKPYPLMLSARSPEALRDLTQAYIDHLGPDGRGAGHSVRDICHSAALRRQHLEHRSAVVGASHEELVAALQATLDGFPDITETAVRYRAGEAVDTEAVFGSDYRYVPLPTYPWQTRRYWPGEAEENGDGLATWILSRHARSQVHAEAMLADIGIDSLAKLQLIVELQKKTGLEVDPAVLGRLRTVDDLRRWTEELEAAA